MGPEPEDPMQADESVVPSIEQHNINDNHSTNQLAYLLLKNGDSVN
jgi:hypothetical protein